MFERLKVKNNETQENVVVEKKKFDDTYLMMNKLAEEQKLINAKLRKINKELKKEVEILKDSTLKY